MKHRKMKTQYLQSIMLSSALATSTHAALVIDFDGTDNNLVTSGNINWGTNASSTLTQSAGNPDIVRSTLAYGTTLATNGVSTYSGPTMKGGFYMNALYEQGTASVGSSNSYWGQIINNVGSQDFIQIRRNNGTGTAGTINNGSTTRGVFTFDTGGSYQFDNTSTINLTGGINITTGEVAHWVVVSSGMTYVSQSSINFTSTGNVTTYTFDDPDATNWAVWAPNSDLSNLPDFTTTVAGTSLSSISEAGFYFEKIGSTNTNPTFRVFTADLAAVPEPSVIALLLGGVGTLVLRRRR